LGHYGYGGPDAKAAMLALEGATEYGGAPQLAAAGAR
jgi:hypothetical protein